MSKGTPELSRGDLKCQKRQINKRPVVSDWSTILGTRKQFSQQNEQHNYVSHTNKSYWQITQFHVYMNLSSVKG